MEVPTRFELVIIELQSIALPLGYGTERSYYNKGNKSFQYFYRIGLIKAMLQ